MDSGSHENGGAVAVKTKAEPEIALGMFILLAVAESGEKGATKLDIAHRAKEMRELGIPIEKTDFLYKYEYVLAQHVDNALRSFAGNGLVTDSKRPKITETGMLSILAFRDSYLSDKDVGSSFKLLLERMKLPERITKNVLPSPRG